MPVPHHFAN